MATTKSISVELGPQQAILLRQLESGHYENASEVVRDALRLMERRDVVFGEWLRAEVKASLADKRPSAPAEDVFARIEARHERRVKAAKCGA
jgi:antitoxin ParD1/3/4